MEVVSPQLVNRSSALGFNLGDQQAWIDNDWKVIRNPVKGQCKVMLPPYEGTYSDEYVYITNRHNLQLILGLNYGWIFTGVGSASKGTFMFNLVDDPTESIDLSKDPAHAARFAAMTAALYAWTATIQVSQVTESECKQPGGGPSPSPGPAPSPVPSSPPAVGFTLTVVDGNCYINGNFLLNFPLKMQKESRIAPEKRRFCTENRPFILQFEVRTVSLRSMGWVNMLSSTSDTVPLTVPRSGSWMQGHRMIFGQAWGITKRI